MKRPQTHALLAASSLGGLQLALFLALVPLNPSDARADSASLGEAAELAPQATPGGLAPPTVTESDAEPASTDEPGAVPAHALRDDILVLLAELPAPQAQASVVTRDPSSAAAVVTEASAEPTLVDPRTAASAAAEADDTGLVDMVDMVDLVLPIKAMGGY